MRLHRAAIFSAALVVACLGSGTAYASWANPGAGSGAVKAAQMPTASAPTATVLVHTATVTWSAATIGGQNVTGYTVKRYNTSGTAQAIGSGCSGTISGLTCTETAVQSGTWRYTVTPLLAGWTGSESPQSASATVQSPALSFSSSTTVNSLPATLNANLANYIPGQTVTFRLDDANTGTVLTSTTIPTSVPSTGGATATVTIPTGVANGSHTVYAVGSQGDVAGTSITITRPVVASATIAKSAGGNAGYIKQGGTYYIYANVTGSGTPPAGLSSLTADAGSITTGQTAAALASGSYTVDGHSYNYRSAQLTAKSTLTAGSKSFTVSLTETSGTKTQTGYTVIVDNTAPTGSDIQATNAGGGAAGRAEAGDTITLTYSKPVDPDSLVSGWDGTSINVTVLLMDGAASDNGGDSSGGSTLNDTIQAWDVGRITQVPLGTIDLGRPDYLTQHPLDVFGVTGTQSTMVLSGSTLTITLGTPAVTADTAAGTGTMTWTPSASVTDRAGNSAGTSGTTENGTPDREF